MNIADLAQSYAEKTDEEILRLAEQREHLTVEAQSALVSELAKRRIATPPSESAQPALPVAHRAVVVDASPIKAGAFIEEVLRFYSRHRWVFIQLIFPAVFLGVVGITFTHSQAHAASLVAIRTFTLPLPPLVLLKISLISASGYIASWMVFCISFATICSARGGNCIGDNHS